MAIFKDLLSERVAKSEAFNPHDFSRHHCHGHSAILLFKRSYKVSHVSSLTLNVRFKIMDDS